MTLIECFTNSHIDNIGACLRLRPEKMIMVGSKPKMADSVKRYQKLLQRKGLATQVALCDVQGKDFAEICGVFSSLVKAESDCIVDLTGGDELVIMAFGAVLAGLDAAARQRVRVEKFDPSISAVVDCINDNAPLSYKSVSLTVEELIALHGGTLHPGAVQLPEDCTHRDIADLWRIVSETPKDWNQAISYLNEFESRADSDMQVYLPMHILRSIPGFEKKEPVVRELLGQLHQICVIDDHSSWDALEYTYQSPLMRYCVRKAGNVLEIKTLLEGSSVTHNGKPFFQDCQMSVSIDWDGIVHNPAKRVPETRNEIDVILMHGLTPLFISCKNGNVEEDELYKLHTVAEQFGGPYAKKMLIVTDLDEHSHFANRAIVRRAWDMKIQLVRNAGELSREEWAQLLKNAVQ